MALVTLPLVLAVVLCELAVGGAFLMWFIDRLGNAPGGFLKLVAVVDVAAVGLAAALVPALPGGELAVRAGLEPGPIAAFGQGIVVVLALLLAQLVAAFLPWRAARAIIGVVALFAGVSTLLAAAIARPSPAPYDVFALLALPIGALALGGADAAMLLGHWYLVTPKLSPGPLRRAALVVVIAAALQLALFGVSAARGEIAPGWQTPLWVAVGIRVGVGILMTLGIAAGAWWTARMNTQSTTGLLYVGLGTVLAGEISARVIFFLTGVAV